MQKKVVLVAGIGVLCVLAIAWEYRESLAVQYYLHRLHSEDGYMWKTHYTLPRTKADFPSLAQQQAFEQFATSREWHEVLIRESVEFGNNALALPYDCVVVFRD